MTIWVLLALVVLMGIYLMGQRTARSDSQKIARVILETCHQSRKTELKAKKKPKDFCKKSRRSRKSNGVLTTFAQPRRGLLIASNIHHEDYP